MEEAEDDEIRAHPLTDGADNLHREAHAVSLLPPQPSVRLLVPFADELVDEIASEPITSTRRQPAALASAAVAAKSANGAADLPLAHGPRLNGEMGALGARLNGW